MIQPEALTLLAGGIGAMLGAFAVWMRANAKIREQAAEAAHRRDQWEQDTIDRLRTQTAQFWSDREADLGRRLEAVQRMNNALMDRITALEQEVAELREDGVRKSARIDELTQRVHQLEVENARLVAQREARDEHILALNEQIASLHAQGEALFTLVGDVGSLVRHYTAHPPARQEQEQEQVA